jgi:hypothetical protein
MPTTVTRYVNTNSTAGGNGTTNATTGANRAYADLSASLAAEFTATPNLVTSDIVLKIVCSGGADTSPINSSFLTVPAFTTDETRYLYVVADTGSRATATWDINKYILTNTGNTGLILSVENIKVSRWEGLQIENRSTNGVWGIINNTNPLQDSILTVDGCYLRSISGSGNNANAINVGQAVRKALRVYNTIIHGAFDNGIRNTFPAAGSSASAYYNNTLFGNFISAGIVFDNIGSNVTGSIKNNIVSGSGTLGSYVLDVVNGQVLTATNISSDATSPQTTLRNINSTLFFRSTASGDFRTIGSVATDAGTDLSTDPLYAFSTDINGTTRPINGSWDIGAYELPVNTAIVNTSAGWVTPIQFTNTAGGTLTEWYTHPVEAATLSGLAVGNIRIAESNTAANLTARLEIAVTDGDGSNVVIWGAATAPIEADVVETVTTVYVAGPDISITQGQRLRFRVYIDDLEAAMGTGYTSTLYYNGSSTNTPGDTYITLPVTLTEIIGPPTPPGVLATINQTGFGNFFSLTQNPNLGTFVNIVRV